MITARKFWRKRKITRTTIDEDRYCIDISNQVLAVISILGKANKEIIRAHLAGCVKDSLTGGTPEEVETKLDEVMSVLDKMSR